MDEKLLYVALGALAALLATFILLILGDLWSRSVLPVWRRWRYRGVNIAGGWKGLATDPSPVPGEWTEVGVTFEQQVRDVRGLLWIRRCSADGCTELRLPVAGKVAGRYVTLEPAAEGDTNAALATALLKIEGRGSSLNGQLLYFNDAMETVAGIQMSVHRAASMALPRLRSISSPAPVAASA